jgi:processive 1,2-diacylglycerol beta-glucosyltransferase
MARKKILLLSVSAGAGHVRAAEAILSRIGENQCGVTAVHMDAMHFVSWLLRKLYVDLYIFLLKRIPSLWGYVYRVTQNAKSCGGMHNLRRWAERVNSKSLLKEIKKHNPDFIVCTHFFPAEVLSQMLAAGKLNCPVWVQVTDFDLHQMWVQERMAGYFVPNDEVAFRMRDRGVHAEKIHVTGIPIMASFSKQLDRRICARELGIDPQVRTLLLMGGGAGLGSLSAVAEHLLGWQQNFQIIALAGKNLAALDALKKLSVRYPGKLVPVGYTHEVERLMACADLAITKPGGLTTSECLAMGLPMIVYAPIPGQEERNANFLLEQGVALSAFDLVTLQYRIKYLLEHPEKLEEMRIKATSLGTPEAACKVLDVVLESSEN